MKPVYETAIDMKRTFWDTEMNEEIGCSFLCSRRIHNGTERWINCPVSTEIDTQSYSVL